ncbi:OLC1v1027210C1 [Oldenlandia corymbosa var. corymbosa]|uniref:OLC1v1027210C1 n=1 Tax=Oldenlandia corymbosa var. corymbosa TaxID=529605 RepID=A0AAV1CAS0_OLDCO|nr:OLC1v1027210C1 [Oldenlandia corymbosa var. corymbosa]
MAGTFFNHLFTAFLFVISLAHFCVTPSSARSLAGTTNTEFIRSSCSSTTYPRLCYSSLANQATVIRNDPNLLASAALSVSMNSARSTSSMMVKLAQSHGLTPREVGAMHDCVETLSDSVDLLRKSMGEMGQLRGSKADFGLLMSDIQTWVSAALTDDDTCTEGFAGKTMNGNTKLAVRRDIVNVAHLTSNALALINAYSSLHG